MGLACGTSNLPQTVETSQRSGPSKLDRESDENDDNWKALLTATTGTAGQVAPTGAGRQAPRSRAAPKATADPAEPLQASQNSPQSSPDSQEAYGLLDEYVDDLLGIPPKDRPVSWSRPSWQETALASGMSEMPEMVLEDGSRGPALPSLPLRETLQSEPASSSREPAQPVPATPYLAGVLNGWAVIDRSAVDPKVVRDIPAPKRRADKAPRTSDD
ncbi:unnamed protein product [Symbiodinium natans]|uniref:Uncharacterized protein n=1 Tax=Symbiodinium natans TaxID=878477 RepID=A0A812KQ00_9DINO|nr:unnamed protein product [Symbiodinium natans]